MSKVEHTEPAKPEPENVSRTDGDRPRRDRPTAWPRNFRILILESQCDEAGDIEQALYAAGLRFRALRVYDRSMFVQALEGFEPDIVVSDYDHPEIDALSVLRAAEESETDAPVLFLARAVDGETAAAATKAGAADCVPKDRLARLPLAVEAALRTAGDAAAVHPAHKRPSSGGS